MTKHQNSYKHVLRNMALKPINQWNERKEMGWTQKEYVRECLCSCLLVVNVVWNLVCSCVYVVKCFI